MRAPIAAVCVVLALQQAACKKRKPTQHVANRRRECEHDCSDMNEDDKPNCVLRCQSEACYVEVYLPDELEPGEIDTQRQRKFNTCITQELRSQAAADRAAKANPPTTTTTKDAAASTAESADDGAESADERESTSPMEVPRVEL